MQEITILAIDNDPLVLMSLKFIFEGEGFKLVTATSGAQGISIFKDSPDQFPIALLDFDMKDKNGLGMNGDEVAKALKAIKPDIRIVMVSGAGDSASVVQSCFSAGAEQFINKREDPKVLVTTVRSIIAEYSEPDDESEAERRRKIEQSLKMVGRSKALSKVADFVLKFSKAQEPVLILGESGSGKEGIARAVHENSTRKGKPFIAVNCGAFEKGLLESELFGHEKGSFTNAYSKKIGLFEQANGGTIFLDEIGDMSLDLQVKILRALQEKTIQPVGGTPKKIDFRVVAATHCNLKECVEKKLFRQDLYYRLKFFTLHVPPLRDRTEDIEPLANHFLKQMEMTVGESKSLSEVALRKLKAYSWPGNVRDLEAVVKSAYMNSEKLIGPQAIEFDQEEDESSTVEESFHETEIMTYAQWEKKRDKDEKFLLEKAMELTQGVKHKAAQLLGINHNTMNYRRGKLGLVDKPTKPETEIE